MFDAGRREYFSDTGEDKVNYLFGSLLAWFTIAVIWNIWEFFSGAEVL
jgi:hypothetical protein